MPRASAAFIALALAAPVAAQDAVGTGPAPPAPASDVTTGVTTGTITVAPLGPPGTGSAGVLPPSVTGLPADLWSSSDAEVLVDLIAALPERLPVTAARLERALMLAEAAPPATGSADALLAARLQALTRSGHLDAAAALADRTGARTPALRRAAFDVALLLGDETEACTLVDPEPVAAEDYARRVFCLLRGGDWPAAATTFDAARAVGGLDGIDAQLLEVFLFPEMGEEVGLPAPPPRPTPLQFRLYEAMGEPMATRPLPVAFSRPSMRPVAGRKAMIEAAERLAAAGALDGARLLALYTERRASASGGVWERVAALRELDAAIDAGNDAAIALALPRAFDTLVAGGLASALAEALYPLVAARQQSLIGPATHEAALRLGLMSSRYEEAAGGWPEARGHALDAARAVARGEAPADPRDPLERAIAAAFRDEATLPPRLARPLGEGRLGEALLVTLGELAAGASGDRARLAAGLSALRRTGLEGHARRIALELLAAGDPA